MARPKLTALRAPSADLFQDGPPAREVAPGPDPSFCSFCGVATWSPYSRRQAGFRQWLKPVWTACDDPDCRVRVDAAVEQPSGAAA
ncbi:hypothetical protein [Methylobacterium currus]|uniref:hypothetical protein n=1 Tax=Methylobacterium currus TaxID=2051553 RepID=UPI000F503A34|nr:hypothetical protein [Methylobacterium currus]